MDVSEGEEENQKVGLTTNNNGGGGSLLGRCCCCFGFLNNVTEAKAYCNIGTGRGVWVASSFFLSASLTYLASSEAGCLDSNNEIIEDCTEKIHGFRPSSLISNIAFACGLFTALFMPVFGAILDVTPHRKRIGIGSSVVFVGIQVAQIFTGPNTWFAMGILMAFSGVMYDINVLTSYAYLPSIGNAMGQERMTEFTSGFFIVQFAVKLTLVGFVTALSYGLSLDDVQTAQYSQVIVAVWMSIHFIVGWTLMPPLERLPRKERHSKHNVFLDGFIQVWRTAKSVNQYYNKGCKWFFLSVITTSPALHTFMILSVVYLDTVLDMNSREMGAIFLVTGFSSFVGSLLGRGVTHFTNPNTSLKLCLFFFMLTNIGGSLVLTEPSRANYVFLFAFLWGISLGWYHPTEKVFFSLCLPKGQDAELSGFYVYCNHILSWIPLLFFTIFNEFGIHMKWGLMMLGIPMLTSILLLSCASSWEDILEEASKNTWEIGAAANNNNNNNSKNNNNKDTTSSSDENSSAILMGKNENASDKEVFEDEA